MYKYCIIVSLPSQQSTDMAHSDEYSMKLNRKGLVMEDLIDDELDILIMILVEMYEPEDIEAEISTAF